MQKISETDLTCGFYVLAVQSDYMSPSIAVGNTYCCANCPICNIHWYVRHERSFCLFPLHCCCKWLGPVTNGYGTCVKIDTEAIVGFSYPTVCRPHGIILFERRLQASIEPESNACQPRRPQVRVQSMFAAFLQIDLRKLFIILKQT